MDNSKELLTNMRGIFLYVDGKYELQIEDTGTSTFSITDNHVIAEAGIGVDYGNKDQRANKVIVEFFNANKKYEVDTAIVLHSATTDANDFTSDDGGEELEVKTEFPLISDPYIAHNMGKAILTRSRNQTTIQFLGTPEMYKLNVGDIVDFTYAGLGFSSKVCRVEALELQSDGLVSVNLIEYFDVYTWEVPAQEPLEELANQPSAFAVKAPTGLAFTDTPSSDIGRPFLSWNEPTDFPDYQYRVNVVDSGGDQVLNKIVDVTRVDLNFIKKGTDYVASVTSLNVLGTESDAVTLTFTVTEEPVFETDIKDDAITTNKILANQVTASKINVTDLVLASNGGLVDGSAIGNFNNNSLRYAHVTSVGTGAGFYIGYVRLVGGTGEVKTISLLFSDGTFGASASNQIDTTVTTGGTDTTKLTDNASSPFRYVTPDLEKMMGLIIDSRLTSSADTTNIPLAFRYTGTGTVNLFIYGQGDSNSLQIGSADARFIKFSAS